MQEIYEGGMRMGNFTFLETRWDDLARLGELSEKYVHSDPNTSVIKQGMPAEIMVKYMLASARSNYAAWIKGFLYTA